MITLDSKKMSRASNFLYKAFVAFYYFSNQNQNIYLSKTQNTQCFGFWFTCVKISLIYFGSQRKPQFCFQKHFICVCDVQSLKWKAQIIC